MDMQDKDFDQLFRSKLDDFEAEPAGKVWDGIVDGLNGKRRYRALLPWLSIAASITLLVAAGILFIPQKHPGATKPPVKAAIAQTNLKPVVVKPDSLIVKPKSIGQPAAVVNNMAVVKRAKTTKTVSPGTLVQAAVTTGVAKPEEQTVLASAQPKQDVINPVVPGVETPMSTKPTVDDVTAAVVPSKAALTASALPANKPAETDVLKPKRSVHGIGGFLNAVIAKVDKRKTKLIEFNDADDDETNVISVNLSAFKSKKADDK